MILGFATRGWEDYIYWQQNDKKILKRVNLLIKDIVFNPTSSSKFFKSLN